MQTRSDIKKLILKVQLDEIESEDCLHLTSYENRMSRLAQSFLDSSLSFRYSFGEDPLDVIETKTGLMLKGLPGVIEMDNKAQELAKEMFHASISNFRPTSGLHATLCSLTTATEVGDLIYSIDPDDGGHFATKHLVERLGRKSQFIPWDSKNLTIDLERFAKMIKKYPPSAIIFEHGTPLFNLPVKKAREIVGENVIIIYDGSHTLGLIAGGEFQDPLREGANILQGNTHKTFPGPQKGMIHFRDKELGKKIITSIGSGLISSQHTHHAIAEYITTFEMHSFGKEYAKQMIKNGKKLAESLSAAGFDLVNKNGIPTTSHEILIKGDKIGGHFNAARKLFATGINTNARVAFRQKIIRLGTQEVTRRGMKEKEMEQIAIFFKRAILDIESLEKVKKDVIEFNRSFPNIYYSFDKEFGLWQEGGNYDFDKNRRWNSNQLEIYS